MKSLMQVEIVYSKLWGLSGRAGNIDMKNEKSPKKDNPQQKGDWKPFTPHDQFFKYLMDQRDKAAALIKAGVPLNVAGKLDWESLKKTENDYLSSDLRHTFSDVVYECGYGGKRKVLISLLIEHKSNVPHQPYLQLLKYMVGIWEKQSRNKESLRPVIPILFFHGPTGWQPRDFYFYFEGRDVPLDLQPFIPLFNFCFFSLQEKSDKWIEETLPDLRLKIAVLLLKYIRSSNLLELVPFIFSEANELLKDDLSREDFRTFFVYLFKGSGITPQKAKDAMEKVTNYWDLFGPSPVGSTAWQMEQESKEKGLREGLEQGLAQGLEQGKKEVALSLLKKGMDIPFIIEVTGLSQDEIEQLGRA